MAIASKCWLHFPGGEPPPALIIPSYLNLLTPEISKPINPIPIKDITYVHGEPIVLWEEKEVDNMIVQENLQFAVIGKLLRVA